MVSSSHCRGMPPETRPRPSLLDHWRHYHHDILSLSLQIKTTAPADCALRASADRARCLCRSCPVLQFSPLSNSWLCVLLFGQLQDVDLQSVEPSIRADTENNLCENAPETFEHRDALIGDVPSYEDPYIKVPRVLSMD